MNFLKIKRAASISFLILNFLQIDAFGKIVKNNQNLSEKFSPEIISKISSYNSYPQIEVNSFISSIANNINNFPIENSNQLNNFQILSNINSH